VRLVFAGTPEFAVPALDALLAAGHEILAVLTQPDRPAGRGRQLTPTAVAIRAAGAGLPVHRFARLDATAQNALRALAPDAMVVVAYGLLLPQAVLDIPRHGCLNIHASLLPRWRGAAPIARAIEAGDTASGITIMRMDAGLDTGPMLLAEELPIAPDTTSAALHDALAPLGGRLVVEALDRLARNDLRAIPQDEAGATYARKLSKEEARLDWTRPAQLLARRVCAFNPAPVAWGELGGERLRIWNAHAERGAGDEPGAVIGFEPRGLIVATGEDHLVITRIQRPGGRTLPAAEALRGMNPRGRHFA